MTEQEIAEARDIGATVDAESMINEILAFCDHGVDGRDLLPVAEYKADPQRIIGHQPGIARAKLANRHGRQTAHMAAGLAQFLARRYAPGVLDDGDLDKVEAALARVISSMIAAQKYELCEFYYFRHPDLRPGFEELAGAVIEGAAEMYPEAWAYLQTVAGQKMCKTEAEWQALSTKGYYTLADGTVIGFNGIGGAPFYSLNTATGALRMPDIRGMYPEAAGFDSLNVGAARIDTMRQLSGGIQAYEGGVTTGAAAFRAASGVFGLYGDTFYYGMGTVAGVGAAHYPRTGADFFASRQAPVSSAFAPRHYGALACAWLGLPHAAD